MEEIKAKRLELLHLDEQFREKLLGLTQKAKFELKNDAFLDSGSGATITPTKTEQLPSALTISGNLKMATLEATVTQPITGSVYAYQTGSWPVSLTGSNASYHDNDNNAIRVNIVAGGLSVTGSTFDFSGSTFVSTGIVSGSVGITGSVTIPVTLVATIISGSVGLTGSSVSITGGVIGLTGSTYTQAVSGSVTANISGGTIGISGSAPLAITDGGSSITIDGTTNVAGGLS